MEHLALRDKPHADLLVRVGYVDLYFTRTWRKNFCVLQDSRLLFFQEKSNYVDYLYNPYLDERLRERLVRRALVLPVACGPVLAMAKFKYFKVTKNAKLVAKLGGSDSQLGIIRAALTSRTPYTA